MSQVSGFGNYSKNQFLFLSGNSTNLKKEDNPQSSFDLKQGFNEDAVEFSSSVSFNVEEQNLVSEEKIDINSEKFDVVENIDFSSKFFIDETSFDKEVFLKNNPFLQTEQEEDSIEKFAKVFLDDEENKSEGAFQFDF